MSFTYTGTVAELLDPDATVPTEVITPGVVSPSGSVTDTASPAFTSDSMGVLRLIVTTCRSEVADRTGPDAGPPRLPVKLADPQRLRLEHHRPQRQRPRRARHTKVPPPLSSTAYRVSHE